MFCCGEKAFLFLRCLYRGAAIIMVSCNSIIRGVLFQDAFPGVFQNSYYYREIWTLVILPFTVGTQGLPKHMVLIY